MTSRRKFLRNSGIAASVMLVTKPFDVVAEAASPFKKGRSITLLHTANSTEQHFLRTAGAASSLKNASGNAVLLNAPAANEVLPADQLIRETGYDAVFATSSSGKESYKIIYKGDIKIGIVNLADRSDVNEADQLAGILKKDKGCKLVVCISSLGYRNESSMDDLRFAKETTDVDVIISGNNKTAVPSTVILNKEGREVLIDHAAGRQDSVGRIEIGFDGSGKRASVSFGQ